MTQRFFALTFILLTLYSAAQGADATPAAKPVSLKVAAIQMRSTRSIDENLAAIIQRVEQCGKDGIRVAVFPECAVTGYFDADYIKAITKEQLVEAERRLAEASRKNNVYIVAGTPCREGDKLYNSAIVLDPSRGVIERYHKIQLAEKWPDPGDHLSVFKIDDIPCSIIVCHDERYPELVRLPVIAGSRVVFYVCHESGIKEEHKINPYRAQIQARAQENCVYVVQANAPANDDTTGSHGQSRIIAPDGNIVQEASVFHEEAVSATLDIAKSTGKFATRSSQSGPLADWFRDGAKRVRMIGDVNLTPQADKPNDKQSAGTIRVAGIVLKWIRGDKEANVRRIEPMIREAAQSGAEIVVTTECFLDGYAIADKTIPLETYRNLGEPIPDGKFFKQLSALAGELKIHLVAGMMEADGEERYNTAVFIGPDGNLAAKYRKQKLGHEIPRNTPGKISSVHVTPFGKMGMMICADRTDADIVHCYSENGAEFLICPSGGMFGPKRNDPIVRARSLENQIHIVFVHPAEFQTAPDGSILTQLLLGDRLFIGIDEIGTDQDQNRICYFDLPRVTGARASDQGKREPVRKDVPGK